MLLLHVVIASLLLTQCLAAEIGDTCTTPNNEKATCIDFWNCTVMTKAVEQKLYSSLEFAQKSKCDDTTLVCCGTEGVFKVEPDIFSLFTKPKESNKELDVSKMRHVGGIFFPDLSTCGIQRDTGKIYGGSATDIDDYPWTIALKYESDDGDDLGFRCGGSLINKRFALTAAHCVRKRIEKPVLVRLGEYDFSNTHDCIYDNCIDSPIDIPIEKIYVHEEYNAVTFNNDIALLQLAAAINYTDFIRPVCLPPRDLPPYNVDHKMTVVGWGISELSNQPFSDVKRELQIPIRGNDECENLNVDKRFQRTRMVGTNQICAGERNLKDACSGDSGGPLMRSFHTKNGKGRQWYLEGIVSWGSRCDGSGQHIGVYTKVNNYTRWIENKVLENWWNAATLSVVSAAEYS